jgi:hypothetical protein
MTTPEPLPTAMPLCSACNERPAKVKGKCQRCYSREYHAKKRAERLQTQPIESETPEQPTEEAAVPEITAEQIDALTTDELDLWVQEKIYGEIYGCIPAEHPVATEAYLQMHPERKRVPRGEWFWPNKKPGYDWYFWSLSSPSKDMGHAWFLLQSMLAHPCGPAFEAMLVDGKFHRLAYEMPYGGQKDAAIFITCCALKAFLLPSLDEDERSRTQP